LGGVSADGSGTVVGERRAVLVLPYGADHRDIVYAAEPRLEAGNLPAWHLSALDARARTGHLIPTRRHSNTTVPLSGTFLPGYGPPDIRKSPDTSIVLASLPVAGSVARDLASLLAPDVQPARDKTTTAVRVSAFILIRRSIGPRRSLVVGTKGGWNARPARRHPNKVASQARLTRS
jgi:hypothetical protein